MQKVRSNKLPTVKMSTAPNLENAFTKVSYRRKRKTRNYSNKELNPALNIATDYAPYDLDSIIRRISETKKELLTTDLFQSVSALIREGCTQIGRPKIEKIICFGLGQISDSTISRFQLALLLCLKDLFHAEVEASDPVFSNNDITLLKNLQIQFKHNIEGKYKVNTDTVLFYLPHCPKQLTNNLLWSNWGLNLSKCIIIGNSITKVVEDNFKTDLEKSAFYINKICPFVLELVIVNSFRLFDIFNDTSVHFFPPDRINLLAPDFWEQNQEPEYSDNDLEFIKKS